MGLRDLVGKAAAAANTPGSDDVEALRAKLAEVTARAEAAERAVGRGSARGVDVERDPNGKGNVVLYRWRQRRPVCFWPSQIDDMAAGVDVAGLPADHILRRLVEAAEGLPRKAITEGAES